MGILKIVVALGLVAALAPAPSHAEGEGVEVLATAYTCDQHPDNPMNVPGMCEVTRWGGANVDEAGMACPAAWRGRTYKVPGAGVLECDDTPRDEYLGGLPHLDIRVGTYEEAIRWGRQVVTIYPPQPEPAPVTFTVRPEWFAERLDLLNR